MTKDKKNNKPNVDLFIKHYLLNNCNGEKAAIDAGYSEKTAAQQASRLLKNVKVKQAIEEHRKVSASVFIWSKEKKLLMLQDIAERSLNMLIDRDGNKRMESPSSSISAIKEMNLMMGHNAPTENINTHNIAKTLAQRLMGGSKK